MRRHVANIAPVGKTLRQKIARAEMRAVRAVYNKSQTARLAKRRNTVHIRAISVICRRSNDHSAVARFKPALYLVERDGRNVAPPPDVSSGLARKQKPVRYGTVRIDIGDSARARRVNRGFNALRTAAAQHTRMPSLVVRGNTRFRLRNRNVGERPVRQLRQI